MIEYRKVFYPKCPYCGYKVNPLMNSYDFSKLTDMATGWGSSDVVLQCSCGNKYRVKCSIRFYASKEGE